VAVRWYLRYGLSYRDVEELLAERGIEVDHVTVYRWVQRFTPLLADAAVSPGDRWFVDETYVKVNGIWRGTVALSHHQDHSPQGFLRVHLQWSVSEHRSGKPPPARIATARGADGRQGFSGEFAALEPLDRSMQQCPYGTIEAIDSTLPVYDDDLGAGAACATEPVTRPRISAQSGRAAVPAEPCLS